MRRRRTSLLFVVAGLAALLASATAGAGPSARTVQVAAPTGAERVVAYGSAQMLLLQSYFGKDPGITRINLNGSVDRSFGDQGTVDIGSEDAVVSRDGKILVATSGHEARVKRLLPDGRPDPSFGNDGSAAVDFGGRYDNGQAVALAANGRILLAGSRSSSGGGRGESSSTPAVARLRSDGSLDRSFARKGVRLLADGGEIGVLDVADTPDGGMVVEVGNEIETALWRLRRDGSVDTGFGNRGRAEVRGKRERYGYHEELFVAPQLAVLPGGKLLLAATGFPNRGPSGRFAVVALRLRPDGRVDRSYGDGGWGVMRRGRGHAQAEGLALLPGGVLAVATTFSTGSEERREFGIVAFGPDGRLERRFGEGGRCFAELAGDHEASGAVAFGRRVVVLGWGEGFEWLLRCPALRGR